MLNILSSYNHTDVLNFGDVDGTPVNAVDFRFRIKERDYIQELNFVSENFGGFSVTAGLFYLNKVEQYKPNTSGIYSTNSAGLFNTAYPAPLTQTPPYAINAKYEKESYAAYAEVSYDLSDKLSVTAAGRYSYETVLGLQFEATAGLEIRRSANRSDSRSARKIFFQKIYAASSRALQAGR